MTENEFREKARSFAEEMSVIDGTCRYTQREGGFSRGMMEKSGLLPHAGATGKTRIVIEYNNDTGEGWNRIVTEDRTSIATLEGRMACQMALQCDPKDYSRCAE
jgi:hypothetical protein